MTEHFRPEPDELDYLKFDYAGEYSPASLIARLKALEESAPDLSKKTREAVASIIEWAEKLPKGSKVAWRRDLESRTNIPYILN